MSKMISVEEGTVKQALEALKLAHSLLIGEYNTSADTCLKAWQEVGRALEQQPADEPVAKPYAYEYGRDNGDGTHSVVIDKGSLVQTQPAIYNYVRPTNAHKDWPIKELFDRPQPAALAIPEGMRLV